MENKDLLEQVIEDRLNTSLDNEVDEKVRSQAHKEAMEAIDRQIQLKKLESSDEEQTIKAGFEKDKIDLEKDKIDLEKTKFELEKTEKKSNRIIKIVEIAAIPVGLFVADCLFKRYYMRQVCNFEKDYSFTTTPGKGISSLFRFKH